MHKNKINWGSALGNNRVYLFLVVAFVLMTILNPKFMGAGNIGPMIKTTVLPIIVGIGFTYAMIAGHFDLSVGWTVNLGAVLVMGQFNQFFALMGGEDGGTGALVGAWILAFVVAIAGGALVGLINGLLVAKGKVHSFIVTLGMMTALSGFVYTYCGGDSITAETLDMVDVMETSFIKVPYLNLFNLRVIIMIGLLIFFEILLHKTKWGRDLLMMGSNRDTAWHAGINVDKKLIQTFIISAVMASISGALFAISMNTAVPNYGEKGLNPLMVVLTATMIGGTSMSGGSGSVVKTAIAAITLQAVFNGMIMLGFGFDAQVLSAGVLLAAVVIFEGIQMYRKNLVKGQRAAMMPEAMQLKALYKESETKKAS